MSVSLCVLRIEIDEDLPEMGDNPPETECVKDVKKKDRGSRESKTITVETYASMVVGPNNVPGILPTSSRKSSPDDGNSSEESTISFFCGNPLIEVTKGVLHLYKENELKEAKEANTLCLLAVPGALGAHDLLSFAAACQQDIAHVRVLRDTSPDHYMALLTFRTSQAAKEFHSAFDGVPYSSLEPNSLCHIAWVSRVEWGCNGAAPANHTELPTCPVCLERMDEAVAGVLSVQCAHAFHAACLLRWGLATCPVCRAAQTPEPKERHHCQACTEGGNDTVASAEESRDNLSGIGEGLLEEVEAGSLWICLICGNVGCGRYENGHAARHFLQTNHTYALQLGSNRVWDYAGDNFVHRLMQNKTDGKLVATGGTSDALDKLDDPYAFTEQLDQQRKHYEGTIDKLETIHIAECEQLRGRAEEAESKCSSLQTQVDSLGKENKALHKKLNTVTAKLTSLQSELSEERGLAKALASNQAAWQAQAQAKEDTFVKEIAELKEQLRDVMFFVEARDKLQSCPEVSREEVTSAAVDVAPPPRAHRRRKR